MSGQDLARESNSLASSSKTGGRRWMYPSPSEDREGKHRAFAALNLDKSWSIDNQRRVLTLNLEPAPELGPPPIKPEGQGQQGQKSLGRAPVPAPGGLY